MRSLAPAARISAARPTPDSGITRIRSYARTAVGMNAPEIEVMVRRLHDGRVILVPTDGERERDCEYAVLARQADGSYREPSGRITA